MASRVAGDEENAPLLEASPEDSIEQSTESLTASETTEWTLGRSARRLYVSHFLSTCNSRVFEFGSVLYLAAIFPGTLLPMSVYAMARGASAILLSSLVGKYIDREDRLKVVRLSISE